MFHVRRYQLALAALAASLIACGAGMNGRGTAEGSSDSDAAERISPSDYAPVPYKKLGSEAFVEEYAGKAVHFKAKFIGEWTQVGAYSGIETDGRVFVNHRDVGANIEGSGLENSDISFPPFALSTPKAKSDLVYELKRGEVFEVWGHAEEAGLAGKRGLHVLADRMAPAEN